MWTITGEGPEGQNCEVIDKLYQDEKIDNDSSKDDYGAMFKNASKNATKMLKAENKKNFKYEINVEIIDEIKEIETAELENIQISQPDDRVFLTLTFSHELNMIDDLRSVYKFIIIQSMAAEDSSVITDRPFDEESRELQEVTEGKAF